MTSKDTRKLSAEELLGARQQIIKWYKSGMKKMKIVEKSGLGWDAVNSAITRYEMGGNKGLVAEKRGRKSQLFSPEQEEAIKEVLYFKKPYHVNLDDPNARYRMRLWSRELVRKYVQKDYGITLSSINLSLCLDRWGLRSNLKRRKPDERVTTEIYEWLKGNAFTKDTHDLKRTYWVDRHTIDISSSDLNIASSSRLSVVTATNGTHEYWCIYKGNFTKERQIGFLKFMIWQVGEGSTIIRCSREHFTHVKIYNFLQKNRKKIEVIPPLLPEELAVLDS